MIRVKNGYLLDLHPPTEYNYRWQSVPTGISRYTEQPVLIPPEDDDDAIHLEFTTGDTAFFTTAQQYLKYEQASVSFSSRGETTPETHVISSVLDGDTYRVTRDGARVGGWNIFSLEPITFAIMADRVVLDANGAYTTEVRLFARYRSAGGYNVQEATSITAQAFSTWLKAQRMRLNTHQVQQQEFLYTVSGGIVQGGA